MDESIVCRKGSLFLISGTNFEEGRHLIVGSYTINSYGSIFSVIISDEISTISSPLTSLTSLEDQSDCSSNPGQSRYSDDTHKVAEVYRCCYNS